MVERALLLRSELRRQWVRRRMLLWLHCAGRCMEAYVHPECQLGRQLRSREQRHMLSALIFSEQQVALTDVLALVNTISCILPNA